MSDDFDQQRTSMLVCLAAQRCDDYGERQSQHLLLLSFLPTTALVTDRCCRHLVTTIDVAMLHSVLGLCIMEAGLARRSMHGKDMRQRMWPPLYLHDCIFPFGHGGGCESREDR